MIADLAAIKRAIVNVGFRGKHEIYDRQLTGAPVDFQIPAIRECPVTPAQETLNFATDGAKTTFKSPFGARSVCH